MVVDVLSIIAHVVSVLAIWNLHRRSKRWQREALELRVKRLLPGEAFELAQGDSVQFAGRATRAGSGSDR